MERGTSQTLQKPEKFVRLLAVVYSSVLLMSAYGPILYPLIGQHKSWLLSMVLMPALIAGMIIPARVLRCVFFHPLFFGLSAAALAVMVQFFPYSNMYFKVLFYIITGFYVGRVALFWSMLFQNEKGEQQITRTFVTVLFFVYMLHIILTVLTPVIEFPWAMVPVAILFLIQGQMVFVSSWKETGAALFYSWHNTEEKSLAHELAEKVSQSRANLPLPGVPAIYIFLMIFSTGFFNTAILTGKEPVWLILPVLVSLASIPLLEKKWGLNFILWIGIASVAFTEMAWLAGKWKLISASLMLFARGYTDYGTWRIGASWAREQNNPMNQTQAVACYVAATFTGGLVSYFSRPYMMEKGWVVSMLSVIPLIIAMLLMWKKNVYPLPMRASIS